MSPSPTPIEIQCAAVKKKLDAAEPIVFIDCREKDEHSLVHLAAAQLLPMSEIASRVAELEDHKKSQVIVHCHHGGRSLRVARWLRDQGFEHAQSMAGGIDQWAVEIDPALPRY